MPLNMTPWSMVEVPAILASIITNSITENMTIAVPDDYDTLQEAWEYLATKRIEPNVTVTIEIAAGEYTHTSAMLPHPQGDQIRIVGASVTFPTITDFVITGNDGVELITDQDNHLVMMKTKFSTKINCVDCGFYDARGGKVHPPMENLLIYKNRVQVDFQENVGIYLYSGLQYLQKLAFFGFDENVVLTNGGNTRGGFPLSSAADIGYLACVAAGGYGFQVSDESSLKYIKEVYCISNTSTGAFFKRAGSGEAYGLCSYGNGGHGIAFENGGGCFEASHCKVKYNKLDGIRTTFDGTVQADSSEIEYNDGYGIFTNGGKVIAPNSKVRYNVLGGAISVKNGFYDLSGFLTEIAYNGGIGAKTSGTGTADIDQANVFFNEGSGVVADYGSLLYAVSAIIYGNGGYGILGLRGSKIIANAATSNGNVNAGVEADDDSLIIFIGGTCGVSGEPNGNGIIVQTGGNVNARTAIIRYNTGRGLYAIGLGMINADGATLSNNTGAEVQVTGEALVKIASVAGLTSADISGFWDVPANIIRSVNIGLYNNSLGADKDYVIASDAITITNNNVRVDTEGGAGTDNLNTINGGIKGDTIVVHILSNTKQTTLKDGVGNLRMNGDFTMTTTDDVIGFYKVNDSTWIETWRSDNA